MIRLFHVSDVHFGREHPAAVSWFTHCVHSERPDAVTMTGDLTMRARSREFDAGLAWLQSLPVPVTVEVGNHDLPYFNPLARLFRPYHRIHKVERLIEKPLAIPGIAVVPMRTTVRVGGVALAVSGAAPGAVVAVSAAGPLADGPVAEGAGAEGAAGGLAGSALWA